MGIPANVNVAHAGWWRGTPVVGSWTSSQEARPTGRSRQRRNRQISCVTVCCAIAFPVATRSRDSRQHLAVGLQIIAPAKLVRQYDSKVKEARTCWPACKLAPLDDPNCPLQHGVGSNVRWNQFLQPGLFPRCGPCARRCVSRLRHFQEDRGRPKRCGSRARPLGEPRHRRGAGFIRSTVGGCEPSGGCGAKIRRHIRSYLGRP